MVHRSHKHKSSLESLISFKSAKCFQHQKNLRIIIKACICIFSGSTIAFKGMKSILGGGWKYLTFFHLWSTDVHIVHKQTVHMSNKYIYIHTPVQYMRCAYTKKIICCLSGFRINWKSFILPGNLTLLLSGKVVNVWNSSSD